MKIYDKNNPGSLILLVVMIALLVAVLIPAFNVVRPLSLRIQCAENLCNLRYGLEYYYQEFNSEYPTGTKWCDLISNYDISPKSFICPSHGKGPCNYALNSNALRLGKDAPEDMVLAFESIPGWNLAGGSELLTKDNHKGNGCHVLYVNGTVEFIKTENLEKLRWTAEQAD